MKNRHSSTHTHIEIGISVINGDGGVAATLWQHLSAAEAASVLLADGIFALPAWSGTWEPGQPALDGQCRYEIVQRVCSHDREGAK